MAVKIFTIANFSQVSTWVVDDNNNLISGPNTDIDTKSVTFSGIPAGSVITAATLTATIGPINYQLRSLDGTFFNGTRNVLSKVSIGATASFEFRFKGSGNTSLGSGTHTAYLEYTNVKVTVTYTEPASGLTLNKTTMKAGDTIRATITPASSTLTHKVKFAMTGVTTVTSATIPAGTKIYDYTVPLAWQNAFPNNASRTVTVTLETYSGSTMTGDVDKTFTLTLSDDACPSITQFDLTRIPGFVDEDITGYIQGFSRARVQSAATGAYSSTISQYKVTVGGWSGTGADVTSPVIGASGNIVVTLQVTDSRGMKVTQTQTIAVLPYSPPSLVSPSVYRSDVSGNEAIAGTNVQIKTGIKISALGDPDVNAGVLKARVYEKGTTAPAWDAAGIVTLTANTASIVSGVDISTSYTIDIQATDKLASYVYTAEISTAKALISGLAEVTGVAIGKYAETAGILDIKFSKGLMNGNPLAFYPVGSIYMSTSSTSPADIFGGVGVVWTKIDPGRFLVAAGTGYAVKAKDGEATHTLTEAEMPSHNHLYSGKLGSATAFGSANLIYMQRAVGTGTADASETYHNKGGGQAHNNMPPYYAVYMWERTA